MEEEKEERRKELKEIIRMAETKGWLIMERWLKEQAEGSDVYVHDITKSKEKREFENGKVYAYGSVLLKVKSVREELDKS